MAIADIIRSGVAVARSVTDSIHVTVTHRTWIGQDEFGNPTYTDVPRKALVERKQRLVRAVSGQEVMSNYFIMFAEQLPPNGAAGRTEPVDVKDQFILPGGVTGPILNIDGFFDGSTTKTYYTQIYMG